MEPKRVEANVRTSLAAAERVFSDTSVKLHWNLPVHPLCGGADQTLSLLTTRVSSERDNFLPMGYAGGFQGYLNEEQLSHELSWCYKNPFSESISGLYAENPVYVFPAAADPVRRQLTKSGLDYAAGIITHRDLTDGISGGYIELRTEHSVLDMHAARLSDIETSASDAKTLSLSGKPMREGEESSIAYIVELHAEPDRDTIVMLLEPLAQALEGTNPPSLGLLSNRSLDNGHTGEPSGTPSFPGVLSAPATRLHRFNLLRRKGETNSPASRVSKKAKIQAALLSAGPRGHVPPDAPQKLSGELSNKVLHAEMPGSVILPEDRYLAHFKAGRFAGFTEQGTKKRLCNEVESYLSVDGKLYRPGRAGSFSFSSEYSRGLRESRSVSTPGGNFITAVEYSFTDGSPSLIVTAYVDFPYLTAGSVDLFAGCEIPIFTLRGNNDLPVLASIVRSDGSTAELDIPPSTGALMLTGSEFTFTQQSMSLNVKFIAADESDVVLPIVFKKKGSRKIFCINPNGSYHPMHVESLSGLSERFTIALTPSFNGENMSFQWTNQLREELLHDEIYASKNEISPP